MTRWYGPSLWWLATIISFIAAFPLGARSRRTSARGEVLGWKAPVQAEPEWERRRASFMAFRRELRSRLLQKRSAMRQQLVIHRSQLQSGSVSMSSHIKLGLSILCGLCFVALMMKFGIFV
eukprot:CAMPEP_0204573158 /NCGR_PEP_ID=MMETSP0661-20131031/39857_1 /ASSEMBLY_ACC=CAM_ASM_000606 /TAXON_ID=109239 /ORGANISM="Alexandrium margalefi, Strain AMGDE01CS-322" /LENGTH=120 /DNA_ID=CAMNT_0051581553 /DNA_START=125 /DNA_END=487 /DNA_ORIENTATION=-